MAASLYTLVLLVGLLWLGAGAGQALLRRIGVAASSCLETRLFGLALGLGAVAYVVLALAFAGLLRPPAIGVALVVLAAVVWRDLAEIAREVPGYWRASVAAFGVLWRQDRFLACAVPIAASMLGVVALEALAPPVGYDTLMYHLMGSRRFLELGRIAPLPDAQQSNQPFTVELLYLIGLGFGSAELGGALHLTCAVLCALAVYAVGRDLLGARTGAVGAIIFLSTTILTVYGPMANIEYGDTLFDFLAVAAFAYWLRERRTGWLVVSSVLLGFSMGSKYLGVLTATALGLCLIVMALRWRVGFGRLVRLALIFGLPAALIAAPWYLKNWVWFGTPVWPFLSPNPPDMNVILAGRVRMAHSLGEFLTLPLRLYTEGSLEYPEARLPLLFLLIPLYLFVPKHPAVTGFLALCLFHLTFWVNGPHVLRYMTPILPELSLASAYMLGCLTSAAMLKRLGGLGAATGRRVASVLVVIGLVVPTVAAAWASLDSRPWLPILGLESREAYLDRRLPNQRLVDYLNEQGDTVRGVLMIGDRRGFYVNAPTWLDISLGAFETLAEAPDADSAREYLASLGVSHVLVSEADIGWHAQWDPERKIRRWWTTFSRTRGRYLTEVERQDTTVLYRVREAPSP